MSDLLPKMHYIIPLLLVSNFVWAENKVGTEKVNLSTRFPCGVASSTAFLSSLGHPVPYEQVLAEFSKDVSPDKLDQLSFTQLTETIQQLGVKCQSVKVNYKSAADVPYPAILYIQTKGVANNSDEIGHFVLLNEVRDDGTAHILDFSGKRIGVRMKVDDLLKFWDGRAIIPVPSSPTWAGSVLALVNVVLIGFLLFGNKSSPVPRNK